MNSAFLCLLVLALSRPTLAIHAAFFAPQPEPAIQPRQQHRCPVACDATWCCWTGEICRRSPSPPVPFECDDPLPHTANVANATSSTTANADSISSAACNLRGVPDLRSCQLPTLTVTNSTIPTPAQSLAPSSTSTPSLTPTESGAGVAATTLNTAGGEGSHRVARLGVGMGVLAAVLASW